MLKIEHLSKNYGDKKAVDDLNLHIAPGEIYGFIGHNGAGKTTTLKSVAGILQFDTGEIYIDGKSIRTQPLECKRSLASMNFMTAPSVSLEGKSLWLLQSLPVEPWRIFRAKIRMQFLLTDLPCSCVLFAQRTDNVQM